MAKARTRTETRKTFGTAQDLHDWIHRRGGRGAAAVMADTEQYLHDAVNGESYTLSRWRDLRAVDFENWGIAEPGSAPAPVPDPEVAPAETEVPSAEA